MKNISSLFIVGTLLLLFTNCGNSPDQSPYQNPISPDAEVVAKMLKDGTAKKLLETNCFTCHQPNSPSHDEMLAPPLAGMKYKYEQAFPKKEQFIYAMSNFIAHPTKERAIMRGPVRRFGLMPKTTLSDDEITAVVTYLSDANVAAPNWFADHFEERHGEKWEGVYLEKGKMIAGATFIALSQRLQKAMKSGGVPAAVEYCNTAALPITDSLSRVHRATIKRTTLQTRNPENRPDDREETMLKTYAQRAKEGLPLEPVIEPINKENMAFYAPIQTNDLCLKCHGTPGEEVQLTDYDLIKKYYPEDQAIGYKAAQLRGMWSITLARE